jgi:enoyl-CoA hydratase/carnithine racemase
MGCSLESREFGKLFTNHESQEGIKAFIEKRTPNFI